MVASEIKSFQFNYHQTVSRASNIINRNMVESLKDDQIEMYDHHVIYWILISSFQFAV